MAQHPPHNEPHIEARPKLPLKQQAKLKTNAATDITP